MTIKYHNDRVVHQHLIIALNAQREEWRLAQSLHPQRVQMVKAYDTVVFAQMDNIVDRARKVSSSHCLGLRES